ncbi:hypothetical protein UA08_07344 [Talaromyces atroroseus]|uniref:Uncharacterized protein n=1 Tax=Talaromyces atroroseus TaxID=1441469 RepID=A0A225ARE7_TALAT|nr:hypothetical protein UA08_07344 [Talaromyces atroroseus]OKL57025.1 hypothetical protein UA08_07344 [Talaromyces atroroseus]
MADISLSSAPEEEVLEGVPAQDIVTDEKKTPVVGLNSEGLTEKSSLNDGNGDLEGLTEEVIHHPADTNDILRHTIHLEDDPTLNALTFRTWFIGCGLSVFGGVISAIYYFKPQTVLVSTVFLAVLAYLLGEGLSLIIPRRGIIGRWLNPHPFNVKEHVAIVVMANSASIAALGIELLAVEGYTTIPIPTVGCRFSCYSLHNSWEIVPEWIMPLLTGVSIFCLADQHSAVFTNIFGGSSGNEGLGLFSLCLDWQYISGGDSPLFYPLDSLISQGIGVCLCMIVFVGVYYGNVWDAQNFPFLSQVLFAEGSNSTNYIQWNQTAVIGANNVVDPEALAAEGLPYFAATYVVNILASNMAITAGIVHICLYFWNDIKDTVLALDPRRIWPKLNPRRWNLDFFRKGSVPDPMEDHYDPHYELMLKYKAVPGWWYAGVLLLSMVVALVCIYTANSTLPWWGFFVACLVATVLLLTFGAMQAITGIGFIIQPFVQLIGGYIQPGNPVANMYFVLFGYNSVTQGQLLLTDMKLAQYGHLAPRVTFSMQMIGTAIGAVFNYIMMNSIVTNQREVLLSIEGTNVWSGQQPQSYNSLAVAWGGMPHQLFSVGGRYQWCTLAIILGFVAPLPFYFLHRKFPKWGFDAINTPILIYFIAYLCVGINSSLMSFFIVGFTSQYYVRRYHPNLFVKYNYLVSAALDGGASVIVFIMSFALFGAAGNEVNFPTYWGNNMNGNFDLCLYTD